MVSLKLKFELKSELSLAKITQVMFYIGCTKRSADTSPDMSADASADVPPRIIYHIFVVNLVSTPNGGLSTEYKI